MHDHIQMISQFESMFSRRDAKRKLDRQRKEQEEENQNRQIERPVFQGRQNPTQSVL